MAIAELQEFLIHVNNRLVSEGSCFLPQGRFELLSLSGSFLVQEIGGHRTRTGGLSVSLAGPDGRVLGGGVAGVLIACTPIQVCSFSHTKLKSQYIIYAVKVFSISSIFLPSHTENNSTMFMSWNFVF